ncbi:hypothetical protein AYI69_g10476 [Smittium culicis]|uniref:Uncharacterized protein n=1 Tax=Smittium culicis TaxID=133412 RepID=A0A1R1X5E7_9FUNG|nr:hypothetical protein AYI69_g10476 [Smittium culicis]
MMRAVVGASGKRLGAVYVHALGNLIDIGVSARALRMFVDTLKAYLEQVSGFFSIAPLSNLPPPTTLPPSFIQLAAGTWSF